MTAQDWDPARYGRFADLRLQPALDLLAAVGELPPGGITDLGCGTGVMGLALAGRYPRRALLGLDASPAMLEQAGAVPHYDALIEGDLSDWAPQEKQALIYSNAVLQWLPDHDQLLPRLMSHLVPGGVLAVQVPHQQHAPSAQAWYAAFADLCGGAPQARTVDVLAPSAYFDILSPLGAVRIWETEYLQHLPAAGVGHPVRRFSESTFGRPFLNALADPTDRDRLLADYDRRVAESYPLRDDGSVLFPFRRLFFLLRA